MRWKTRKGSARTPDPLAVARQDRQTIGVVQRRTIVERRRRLVGTSNGLSILAGNGEWIWRPLNNPKHLAVSSYAMENPAAGRTLAGFPSHSC
jgi:hypothetical protein